jgi:predicted RNA-binding protein with PIN domain
LKYNKISSFSQIIIKICYIKYWRFKISYLIIDGYNLIGIYHKDLKKEREKLIDSLISYRKRKGHEITVVFDGWKTGEAKETQSIVSGIRIIFSRIGENADSVIKRIISTEKHDWIVITSDREIKDFAFSSGAIPIPAEMFLNIYKKPHSFDKQNLIESEETDYSFPQKKGSPRKLSKKEKLVMRALKKL